jgi:hypothetical protein
MQGGTVNQQVDEILRHSHRQKGKQCWTDGVNCPLLYKILIGRARANKAGKSKPKV